MKLQKIKAFQRSIRTKKLHNQGQETDVLVFGGTPQNGHKMLRLKGE